MMKNLVLAAVLAVSFGCGTAMAQEAGAACASKAVSAAGQPLAGAARTSSIKKCCEGSAVGSDGKKLAGAARTSFLKKCESGM